MADFAHQHSATDKNILGDARWFPTGLAFASGTIAFDFAERDILASQTFLDTRWVRAGKGRRVSPLSKVTHETPPLLNFIWHTGFCCSTLVAKAIDRRGLNLSLCEPQILVELAGAKYNLLSAGTDPRPLIETIWGLLARRHAPTESITLKPSPAANSLLRDAILTTQGTMLFLYSDCRSFLVSVAKLGEEGRRYARSMFLAIIDDGNLPVRWPPERLMQFSDLEIAALVWHMQIAEFLRSWPLLPAGRGYSLDCDVLLDAPADVLARVAEQFSIGFSDDELREVVVGPLLHSNAKTGEPGFDAAVRRMEHERIATQLGSDLDRIVAESYERFPATPRGRPLPNPLVETKKSYVA